MSYVEYEEVCCDAVRSFSIGKEMVEGSVMISGLEMCNLARTVSDVSIIGFFELFVILVLMVDDVDVEVTVVLFCAPINDVKVAVMSCLD